MARPAIPRTGCAVRVSVIAACRASVSARLNAAGGNIAGTHFSPRSSRCRSRGKATNSSASIPGRWLPCPGNRKAIFPSSASSSSAPPVPCFPAGAGAVSAVPASVARPALAWPATPRSPPATKIPAFGSWVNARARFTRSASSSRLVATNATRTAPPRLTATVAARSRSFQGRPAPSLTRISSASRSRVRQAAARSVPRMTNSSAGQASSPWVGSGAPS